MLRGRSAFMVGVVALVATVAGCTSGESATLVNFSPVSGEEVIAATRAERTAEVTIREHTSASTAGPDDDGIGQPTEDQTSKADYDFERNRAVVRWQWELAVPEITPLGVPSDQPDEARGEVEARSIGDTVYVKDGSWLCPACGMDDTKPLPSDQWIAIPLDDGDPAFGFTGPNTLYGQFGWMVLVRSPVTPRRVSQIDGDAVGVYMVTVPTEALVAALPPAWRDDRAVQGDTVAITFWADEKRRLRKMVVEYRQDDQDRTVTATVNGFGSTLEIEEPADDEIYRD